MDAFQALLAGSKQQSKKSASSSKRSASNRRSKDPASTTPKAQPSSQHEQVPCPICQQSFAVTTIERHANQCLLTASQSPLPSDNCRSPSNRPISLLLDDDDDDGVGQTNTDGTHQTAAQTRTTSSSSSCTPGFQPASSALKTRPVTHGDTATPAPKRPKAGPTGTVHDFFGGRDLSVPGYFHLEWLRGHPCATFFRGLPSAAKKAVDSKIKWQGKELQLTTRGLADFPPTWNRAVSKYQNVPMLKSHLQKCIRRSRSDLAVQTARELLLLDPSQLLRRLTIIAVEDVVVSHNWAVVVWLMAAHSKGFVLDDYIVAWLLGYVHQLAACKQRDPISHSEDDGFDAKAIAKAEVSHIDDEALVYALQLRASYGGMGFDVKMLNQASTDWLNRVSDREQAAAAVAVLEQPVTPIQMRNVPSLKREDWELSAVDFHCSNIQELVLQSCQLPPDADFKDLMWHCSSAISNKTVYPWAQATTSGPSTAQAKIWAKLESVVKEQAAIIVRQRA